MYTSIYVELKDLIYSQLLFVLLECKVLHLHGANQNLLLQSLIHQPSFKGVKGIVIGRFQKKSEITKEKLIQIINTKAELKDIPVISNVDFGHTSPIITFPIGGEATVDTKNNSIIITKH